MVDTTSYRNTWGSRTGGQAVDQVRADLFRVQIVVPPLWDNNFWDSTIAFTISKFPFPTRSRDMIPVKYLNQTNYQLGADTASEGIDLTARYAFNQTSAEMLEKWQWATSHPTTGGVALTSAIKGYGYMNWLGPDMQKQIANAVSGDSENPPAREVMVPVSRWFLEGILLKGLKPSDGDMESTNTLVNLTLSLQIDRYYPINTKDIIAGLTTPQQASPLYTNNRSGRALSSLVTP